MKLDETMGSAATVLSRDPGEVVTHLKQKHDRAIVALGSGRRLFGAAVLPYQPQR